MTKHILLQKKKIMMYHRKDNSFVNLNNADIVQKLFKSMNLLRIFLFVIFTKMFRKPFVKDKSRYRKINFFTTSVLLNCIIWVNNQIFL
jgi:hypothetical protein